MSLLMSAVVHAGRELAHGDPGCTGSHDLAAASTLGLAVLAVSNPQGGTQTPGE
jgi:hypothetical protein